MKCKAYISDKCEESMLAKEILDKTDFEIVYINITESMENLGSFLKLRDTHPFFDSAKLDKRVGVPTLVFGENEFFFDVESGVDLNLLLPYFEK